MLMFELIVLNMQVSVSLSAFQRLGLFRAIFQAVTVAYYGPYSHCFRVVSRLHIYSFNKLEVGYQHDLAQLEDL